ncbi:Phosphatidylinositol-glycan-specific phospholipase D, partial [Ophiophagus hannah]
MEFFSQQVGQVDYRKLILAHQDAYQAGSLYPDAFYSVICQNALPSELSGMFHYVSEDTHWSPFLNTSIHYIRKNYPQPWEEATEKLVAFLFGIASHMVADVSWHSLGIEQGFLRAMAALYPIYANKSPFLVDRFYDYFLGGVDDMAFSSNNIFQLTSWMFNYGTRFKESRTQHHRKLTSEVAKSVEKNISYTERGVYLKVPHWKKDGYDDLIVGAPGYSQLGHIQLGRVYIVYGNESGLPHSNLDLDQEADEILEGTKGSVYIFLGNRGGGFHSLPNITIICQRWFSPYLPGLLFVSDADWMVKGETDYGWFGSSLSSVQLLNKTLLLIGSPFGRNCTSLRCYFSQYNKQAVGTVYGYIPPNTKSWFTLSGDDENGKFGSALATGFLSIEGISKQVLIVGAPTQGSVSRISFISSALHQAGSVLIYDLMGNGTPSLLSTFNGDRRFSRFGEEVHLRDLNNDGLEQFGYVYIYSGNQTTSGHVTDHCRSYISPCPRDWAQYVIISPEEKSRFGSTLLTMKTGEKKSPTDVMQCESQLSGKGCLPHGNLLQASCNELCNGKTQVSLSSMSLAGPITTLEKKDTGHILKMMHAQWNVL